MQTHRYPGITFVAKALSQNTSRRVLDLGSASAASFNFFMRKGCTVRFENISQFISDQWVTDPEKRNPASICKYLDGYLSSFRSHEKFDVVLAWDLFNYLDLNSIKWLLTKLSAFCHDQSILHSIRYLYEAPAALSQFQIVSEHEVKCQAFAVMQSDYKANSLPDLLRHMPFYHLDTSFSQQSGMPDGVCEDVLRFMPSKKNIKRHASKMELPSVAVRPTVGNVHRSYALETLCEHLSHIEAPRILDLGANIESNREFYHNFSNHVVFAELFNDLRNDISAADILSAPNFLHCDADEKFDVIFAWGLLGYCTQEQLLALKQRLLPHMHKDTKIHVVIYAGYTQPTTPDRYYIKDTCTLYLPQVEDYCSTQPPLTAIRLLKILGDASYQNSFIMKPGMAPNFFEHILVLQKTKVERKVPIV
ncbi:MAG: hypothetical protein U5M23_01665 [Marinagarivorans sp.]|nr:hypothetical protein [Marinagarivorans sp.]